MQSDRRIWQSARDTHAAQRIIEFDGFGSCWFYPVVGSDWPQRDSNPRTDVTQTSFNHSSAWRFRLSGRTHLMPKSNCCLRASSSRGGGGQVVLVFEIVQYYIMIYTVVPPEKWNEVEQFLHKAITFEGFESLVPVVSLERCLALVASTDRAKAFFSGVMSHFATVVCSHVQISNYWSGFGPFYLRSCLDKKEHANQRMGNWSPWIESGSLSAMLWNLVLIILKAYRI